MFGTLSLECGLSCTRTQNYSCKYKDRVLAITDHPIVNYPAKLAHALIPGQSHHPQKSHTRGNRSATTVRRIKGPADHQSSSSSSDWTQSVAVNIQSHVDPVLRQRRPGPSGKVPPCLLMTNWTTPVDDCVSPKGLYL